MTMTPARITGKIFSLSMTTDSLKYYIGKAGEESGLHININFSFEDAFDDAIFLMLDTRKL